MDIDDTLIASTSSSTKARLRCLEFLLSALSGAVEKKALKLEPRLYEIFGWSKLPDLWRALALELGLQNPTDDLLEGALKLFEETYFETLKPLPTVEQTLKELEERSLPVGIISDGDEELQWRKLRSTGLDRFFDPGFVIITIQSDIYSAKPSTANFCMMEKLLGFKPEDIAYVGDKPWDVAAANVAGWRSVRTRQVLEDRPDFWPDPALEIHKPDNVIYSFSELLELV